MPTMISPLSHVDPAALLGRDVIIGPFCVVGPEVRLGDECRLESHVTIVGRTTIGNRNRFWPNSVIGTEPQDRASCGDQTETVIGDDNQFREGVTVHRGAEKEVTSINFREDLGEFLATSGDGQVRLLNEKGEKVRGFEGSSDYLNCGATTPEGRFVIAGGVDGVMRVWDGADGKLLASFAAE